MFERVLEISDDRSFSISSYGDWFLVYGKVDVGGEFFIFRRLKMKDRER